MTRAFQLVVAFAALALTANALNTIVVSTTSLTSASFANTTVSTVLDASATANTDYTGGWNGYTKAYFAPGTANTTVYLFGVNSGSGSLTKVGSRTLNATMLSNGTAAKTGDATVGTDVSESITATVSGTPKVAVGLGGIAIAYVASDGTTVACNQVYLRIYNGGTGTAIATLKLTSNTCVACFYSSSTSLADGVRFDPVVGNVFYENGTYFVSYTNVKNTYASTSSDTTNCPATAGTTAPASTLTFTSFAVTTTYQGYAATSTGTATWTTAPTIYTATTATPAASTLNVMCGPQNYTNSTTHYCVYKDGSGTTANLKAIPVTVSSGTAGSAVTVATDSVSGTTYPMTTNVYTCAGFVYSQYQQGILVNNYSLVTSAATSATYTYANTLQLYNLTSGATAVTGGVAITGLTNTVGTGGSSSAQYSGAGVTYSQGYLISDVYTSATTPTYTYEYSPFLANSTLNGTKTTIATSDGSGSGNWFVDANGALWFGGYTVDTGNGNLLATATIGKVIAQIYYSAGNVLASFVALLSLMIAALFAF